MYRNKKTKILNDISVKQTLDNKYDGGHVWYW